ncbi:MAG: glycosyltransferase family 4 protein [Chlorobiaceae bacterium]|nr:glycosyltransferase family 4 protein [Chlorobiaceae bacterium]
MLKKQLAFKEMELQMLRMELSSVYKNFLGQIVKKWKEKKKHISSSQGISHVYIDIPVRDVMIRFHDASLSDNRGIGRFSHELLHCFQSLQKNEFEKITKAVYFYPSIHYCPKELPTPSCVVLHDIIPMIFPELFGVDAVKWYTDYLPITLKAKKIITISNSSADSISQYLSIHREKIAVIHNGISTLSENGISEITIPAKKYVVFLGTHDRNKNIPIVLKALESDELRDISLVMIGNHTNVRKLAETFTPRSRVYFMGRLDDQEAAYVIGNAIALVFPSIYEGFGLPPLEAALCGTPTICSDRPAMNEIMSGCALFADPENSDDWVDAIRFLRDHPDERQELVRLAQRRAQEFSWEKTSESFLDIMESIAE